MNGATAENVHIVHTEWLNKIDFLWKMLEGRYQATLCREYEDRIKANKGKI
jgi:pyrroloquinoline quinone (PQQ) biosynthesis protein C